MAVSRQLCACSIGAIVLALLPCAAVAQDNANGPANSSDAAEIIVTANKRSQSINDVPMSITAVTGEGIVAAGVKDISDLARVAPGYTFTKTHDAVPVLTIRGVGYYDNNVGATPAVSAYVDEVPLPYPVMSTGAVLDLDRVEVLKGPQGTLFGQNSTGGALNFIAAKPTSEFGGEVSIGYGRFDTLEISGHVTGALAPTLNARVAGQFERGSAWQYSYTRPGKTGRVERGGGRLLLDWSPAPALDLLLTLEGWYDKSDQQAGQLIGLAIQFPGCQNPALATGGGTCFGPPDGPPLAQVYPNAPRDPRAADWSPGIDYAADNRLLRAALRAKYDLSDDLALISITSIQDFDYETHPDGDATSLEIADLANFSAIKAFYQELRLQGSTGSLNWMVGGNYSTDKVETLLTPRFRDWSLPLGSERMSYRQDVEVYASFANLEYEIGGGVKLQAGARYTRHEQRMRGCPRDSGDGVAASLFNALFGAQLFGPGDCVVLDDRDGSFAPVDIVDLALDDDNVSWRAGATYQPNSDLLFYANVSKGYKAGAFTLPTFQLVSQFEPAKQESVLAYEAGFKIGDGTVQLNGAGFYYDYRDKQILAPFDFGAFGILDKLQNIPRSRVAGAELEAAVTPTRGLRLSISGTYVESKVTSEFIASSPFGGDLDLHGEAFPYTPKYQVRADVGYQFPVSNAWDATLGASMSFRSESNARFGGGQLYELNDYALVDLRAGIETSDRRYRIDIWGRNIGNAYYRVNATTSWDTVFAVTGQPATYGARFTARF